MQLNTEEQLAVDEFERIDTAYNYANDSMEEIFHRRVVQLCDEMNYQSAVEYVRLMPESVAKIFCMDYIRHARGDYE